VIAAAQAKAQAALNLQKQREAAEAKAQALEQKRRESQVEEQKRKDSEVAALAAAEEERKQKDAAAAKKSRRLAAASYAATALKALTTRNKTAAAKKAAREAAIQQAVDDAKAAAEESAQSRRESTDSLLTIRPAPASRRESTQPATDEDLALLVVKRPGSAKIAFHEHRDDGSDFSSSEEETDTPRLGETRVSINDVAARKSHLDAKNAALREKLAAASAQLLEIQQEELPGTPKKGEITVLTEDAAPLPGSPGRSSITQDTLLVLKPSSRPGSGKSRSRPGSGKSRPGSASVGSACATDARTPEKAGVDPRLAPLPLDRIKMLDLKTKKMRHPVQKNEAAIDPNAPIGDMYQDTEIIKILADSQDSARALFERIDEDNSGMISDAEMVNFLINSGMTKLNARLMVTKIDVNQDGEIDFDEFKKFHKELHEVEKRAKQARRKGRQLVVREETYDPDNMTPDEKELDLLMKLYNKIPSFRWSNGDSIPEPIMPLPEFFDSEFESLGADQVPRVKGSTTGCCCWKKKVPTDEEEDEAAENEILRLAEEAEKQRIEEEKEAEEKEKKKAKKSSGCFAKCTSMLALCSKSGRRRRARQLAAQASTGGSNASKYEAIEEEEEPEDAVPQKKKKARRLPFCCKKATLIMMYMWSIIMTWLILVYGLKFEQEIRDAEDSYQESIVQFDLWMAGMLEKFNTTDKNHPRIEALLNGTDNSTTVIVPQVHNLTDEGTESWLQTNAMGLLTDMFINDPVAIILKVVIATFFSDQLSFIADFWADIQEYCGGG